MTAAATRLLCIDLQIDPDRGLQPDAQSIFCARQLLALGRSLGWEIAHTRQRGGRLLAADAADAAADDIRISGMRPLMSERVFLRSGRTIGDSPGLAALLDDWRDATVYVAAFDPVALLSCLVECREHGPRLVLVEDALAAGHANHGRAAIEAFRSAAGHLATGTTSVSRILQTPDQTSDLAPSPESWRDLRQSSLGI